MTVILRINFVREALDIETQNGTRPKDNVSIEILKHKKQLSSFVTDIILAYTRIIEKLCKNFNSSKIFGECRENEKSNFIDSDLILIFFFFTWNTNEVTNVM